MSRSQLAERVAEPVEIVSYDGPYIEAQREFAHRMWPSRRRRREERYLRWKFRGPREGPVDGLLLAVQSGKVIGQLGLIPVKLRVGERIRPAQWACDLMVDTAIRRRGVASLLFAAALDRPVVTLGSNPSAAAAATMSRVGFGAVAGPRIMVFPIHPSHVLSWKVPPRLSWLTLPLGWLLQPLARLRMLRLERHAAAVHRRSWHEVVGLVSQWQRGQAAPQIVHDSEFLQWRCAGLQGFTRELQAVVTDSGGYGIVGAAFPYFYVYDWGSATREDCFAIFAEALRMARQSGCRTVQAFARAGSEEAWLREAGFLGMRHRCVILCHPPETLKPAHERMDYCIYDSDGNL